MSYVMTYSSLIVDLQRYLERGFTEESDPIVFEQLPRLVTLGERRIARELKILGFLRAVSTTLVVGQANYAKPDRWRKTVSMVANGAPLFGRSYEYIRNYWPDAAQTGVPAYYSDYDFQHWLIAPTPSAASTLNILYYEQPPLLGDDCQSNWITDYAPDLLLYASLLEASPFLKKDDRVQTWQALFDRASQAVNGEDAQRILDRASTRSDD